MKKVISLFLLSIFLISNSGATISLHWCGKTLTAIHLNSVYADGCKCEKKEMKNDCCKNKSVHLKVSNHLFKANQFEISKPSVKLIDLFPICFTNISSKNTNDISAAVYHPPLFKPKVPVFITVGNFLI